MFAGNYNELPEFLQFNRYGGVLTPEERERVARTKGVCSTCGQATHKVTPFRSIPLNNEHCHNGVCLKCNPQHRATAALAKSTIAGGGKAAKLLGQTGGGNSNVQGIVAGKKTAKQLRSRFHDSKAGDGSGQWRSRRGRLRSKFSSSVHSSVNSSVNSSAHSSRSVHRHSKNDDLNGSDHSDQLQRSGRQRSDLSDSHRLSGRRTLDEGERTLSARELMPSRESRDQPDARAQSMGVLQGLDDTNDAWEVVKAMRDHPDDVALLTRTCNELRNIGSNNAGSLYEVIEVMRRFPEERELQKACIGALWSQSADGGDDNKLEILDGGGAEVIIEAMGAFYEDAALLSWGLGALSSLAEGRGGRAILEEEGAMAAAEEVLKNFHNPDADAGAGTEVLYWVFRCMVALICDYSDAQSANGDAGADMEEEQEDLAASRKCRAAVVEADMIHMAWLSINSAAPMDGVTLEWAFKFLSHFEVETYLHDCDKETHIMGGCEKSIMAKPHDSFPVLHHLACAFLCLAMKIESYDREEWTTESTFVRVAVDVLTADRKGNLKRYSSFRPNSFGDESFSSSSVHFDPPPNTRDVMICTLAHLLCFGNVTLGFAESNNALKVCCTLLDEGDSVFQQGSCIWTIWSMFHDGSGLGSIYASKAAASIQHVFPSIKTDPVLVAVAFSALAEVVTFVRVEAQPLIEEVVSLVSEHSDNRLIGRESSLLLSRMCKTRELALLIASSDWPRVCGSSLSCSDEPCAMTAHLMIKLSVLLADDDGALSIEDHEAMIDASVQLKDISPLAAKSWLGFLAVSITPDKEDFEQSLSMAVKSIKEILESFPKNLDMQKLALMAMRNMAVSIQKAELPLDVSACVRPVLDAQKEHGVEIYEECCGTMWALMGVECELDSSLLREVVYFAIEVTEIHILSAEHPFNEDIVSAGMAILANAFSNPVAVMKELGEKIVDIVVDVVNTTVFSCLDMQENFPRIFMLAFRTLRRLCNDDSCRDIIVNQGGIVAVVDVMSENLESPCIQENGCNILRRLAGQDLEMKLKIVEADGVDVIMNIMISHGDKARVLSEAFQALSCLSVDKTSRNFIAQQGGVMVIANSMSILPDSVELQDTGLAALCNLASDVEEGILEASNIYAVVNDSLERHGVIASIQRQGLALFYNLSIRSAGMRNQIVSSGCLRNIIQAVDTHASNPKVLTSALSMLINLADTEECKTVLLEKKTISLIVHAITLNIDNLKVAIVGCNILDVICVESSSEVGIGYRGVEAVVYAMMIHYSSEYIQDTGCSILSYSSSSSHSFVSVNGDFDPDLFDIFCKMVEVLLSAMSCFPRNFQVQDNATLALCSLAKVEENMVVLNTEQARMENVLSQTMSRYPSCHQKCQEVLKALAAAN